MKRIVVFALGVVAVLAFVVLVGLDRPTTPADGAPPSMRVTRHPDVVWLRNFGPDRGVLELRVSSSLGDELVVAGHTNGGLDDPAFGFVGSFDPATGEPTVRHGTTEIHRWERSRYWGLAAATGHGGSPDVLIAVGHGFTSENASSGHSLIDVFRDKRDTGPRTGFHWNLLRRVGTDYFQVLAVGGVQPDPIRFVIGAGRMVPAESGGGYEAIVAVMDEEGHELARDRMSNGGVINIHDLVVHGGRVYVAGSVTRYFEGMEPIGGRDVFVRAYRLTRGGGEDALEPLWTRRFATGWSDVAELPRAESLMITAMDRAGNLYVSGYTDGFLEGRLPDERGVHRLGGSVTSFVVKYDADGNRLWARQFGADNSTAVQAMATDCAGNVWLGGATQGVFGGETRRSDEPHGGFIVRLDPGGNTTWTNSSILRGRIGDVDATWYVVSGLALDAEGRLFASGYYLDNWGTQPTEGKQGFVAALSDPIEHLNGPDGFASCPPSTARHEPPAEGGMCVQAPDATVLVLPNGVSVPHEGFQDEPACSNGVDDDNDGLCDALDPDCAETRPEYEGTRGCIPLGPDLAPRHEGLPSPLCWDGIDNDGNGICDQMEPGCQAPRPGDQVPLPSPGPVLRTPVATPTACKDAVQDRIAWDYDGHTHWEVDNVARLCRGAETTPAPARCFERVMHGGVDYGGGTRWQWANAIDLCEGSQDADATVACFQAHVAAGDGWPASIDACEAR